MCARQSEGKGWVVWLTAEPNSAGKWDAVQLCRALLALSFWLHSPSLHIC